MARIKTIDIDNENEIGVYININKEEYDLLRQSTENIILIPQSSLRKSLTAGKLGNSNRIMLPKKIVRSFGVEDLDRKVPAAIFRLEDRLFLLAEIKNMEKGVPQFKEVKE